MGDSGRKKKNQAVIALTEKKVENIKIPGMYKDTTDNLYLSVTKTLGKSWIFRYQKNQKRRDMGLGSVGIITLLEARSKANELLIKLKKDPAFDPIEERKVNQKKIIKTNLPIFSWCVEQYVEAHQAEWSSQKHINQWRNTLKTYAFPVIGDLEVNRIDTDLVLKILKPIWDNKNETATRVRGRISKVLDWAAVNKYRDINLANPASWEGNLEHLLAKPSKVKVVTNFSSLPYKDIGVFLYELEKRNGISPIALKFLILTAARTSEVVKASWTEINFEESLWHRPAWRMKGRRAHTVTLSKAALKLITDLKAESMSAYIFPGLTKGKPLSTGAMDKLLEDMGYAGFTVHGFRSTFRDWSADKTTHENFICEMALAHKVKDKAEAAYKRTELIEKRMVLMNEWADFCEQMYLLASKNAMINE